MVNNIMAATFSALVVWWSWVLFANMRAGADIESKYYIIHSILIGCAVYFWIA